MDFKTKNTLPDLPSALIRVALADLKLCSDDDKYVINMMAWHTPNTSGIPFINRKTVCNVCMAGSVMAQTLHVPIDVDLIPYRIEDSDTVLKLLAVNHFRTGDLHRGISLMCGPEDLRKLPGELYSKPVVRFAEDPVDFCATLNSFADDLEKVGL